MTIADFELDSTLLYSVYTRHLHSLRLLTEIRDSDFSRPSYVHNNTTPDVIKQLRYSFQHGFLLVLV